MFFVLDLAKDLKSEGSVLEKLLHDVLKRIVKIGSCRINL